MQRGWWGTKSSMIEVRSLRWVVLVIISRQHVASKWWWISIWVCWPSDEQDKRGQCNEDDETESCMIEGRSLGWNCLPLMEKRSKSSTQPELYYLFNSSPLSVTSLQFVSFVQSDILNGQLVPCCQPLNSSHLSVPLIEKQFQSLTCENFTSFSTYPPPLYYVIAICVTCRIINMLTNEWSTRPNP